MNFMDVPNRCRPIPFWSWNERLDETETRRQIAEMDGAGIGGFFMHARGGLQTEYMGEEWFANVEASIDEAKKRNMRAWAYDENGWPSGFGGGIVNGRGVAYQQKYLRFEKGEGHTERTIANTDGFHFYYDVNPFYVDTFDGKVTDAFIREIYEPYYERFGASFEGFFTDEPQISRNGIPWSLILPDEYKRAYGEDLLNVLPQLFMAVGDYKRTRVKFWKLVTELFSKNFMKKIFDFCDARGLKLTGHLVLEENLLCQLTTNGACLLQGIFPTQGLNLGLPHCRQTLCPLSHQGKYLLYAGETLEVETILAFLHLDFGARREGREASGFPQRRGPGEG